MGSALSRKQADDAAGSDRADIAAEAVWTNSVPAKLDCDRAEISAAEADIVDNGFGHHEAAPMDPAEPSTRLEQAVKLDVSQDSPADIAMILQAGLHKDIESDTISTAEAVAGYETSEVKATVQELRDKFGINRPMTPADEEQIAVRKELNAYEDSLKERLKRMRQAHTAVRKTQAVRDSESVEPSGQQPLQTGGASFVHVAQTSARSHRSNSSSSANTEASSSSSSSEASAAGSSSSSGSSLHLKSRNKRQKLNSGKVAEDAASHASESEVDEEDEEDKAAVRKALKQAAAFGPAISANPMFASKHEVLDPSIPTALVPKLPEGAAVYPFGVIESVINSVIVIRAGLAGDVSQILDEGSLACLEDGRVLGPIFETFGAITAPMYSIRMPTHTHPLISGTDTETVTPEEKDAQSTKSSLKETEQESSSPTVSSAPPARAGVRVYFCPDPAFSTIVFTRDVKSANIKGSDASNLYDEEPAGAEIEFSDDEQEQAYKQALKQRRRERRSANDQQYGGSDMNGGQGFEFDDDDDTLLDEEKPLTAGLEEEEGQDLVVDVAPNSYVELATPLPGTTHPDTSALTAATSLRKAVIHSVTTRSNAPRSHDARGGFANSGGRGLSRESRGRGRGRGRGDSSSRPPRGRGSVKGSSNSDRYGPPQTYSPSGGPAMLPRKPAFQHPDALPYDNILPYDGPGNSAPYSPMSASLPPRPMSAVEPYVPMSHLQRSPPMSSSGPGQNQFYTNSSAGYNPGYRSNWEQPGYTPQHAMPMQGSSAGMPQLFGPLSSGLNPSPMSNRPNSGPYNSSHQPMYSNDQQWRSR